MRLNNNMSSLSIYNGYKKNLINNKSAIERLSTGIETILQKTIQENWTK